jgi:hypothetical protein
MIITYNEIAAGHPRGMKCSSDSYYATVGNKILHRYEKLRLREFSPLELKECAINITQYFEDVVSDFGLWRSFTNWHKENYGKFIPFYHYEEDKYYQDEPHIQDCMLIIWLTVHNMRPNAIPYPMDLNIVGLAQAAWDILNEEFEKVPVNEDLKNLIANAEYANDFFMQRDILKWLFFNSYLTHTAENEAAMGQCVNAFKQQLGPMSVYVAECALTYENKVSPLALSPQEFLGLVLRANGKEQEAKDIEEQEYRPLTYYKILNVTDKDVELEAATGEKLIVTRHNLNDPDPDKLKGYALCSLVNYKGDWFLNGFFTTSETGDEAFEEMKKVEEKKKNDRVPNYKHLKEISEDTGLFYFENKDAHKEFTIKELGLDEKMANDMFNAPQMKTKENITVFVGDEKEPQGIALGVAKSIKDNRNTMYDEKYAKANALVDTFNMPDTMVKYLVKHNMLPDAAFGTNQADGIDHTQLLQENFDFVMRALRGNAY